jgi:arylsulfatase A-like enzyme
MLTCYHPAVHGATSYAQVQAMHDKKTPAISVLNEDQFNTLPELLHEAGYEAAGFVANKFLMKEFGFAQGYDHYDASFSDNTVRGEVVNNAALTWLRQRKSQRPLFLYLHYMDVHGPYNAAREFMDPLIAKVRAIPPEKRTTLSPELFNRINPYLRKPPANGSDLKDYEELRGYREYWVARYEAGVAELDHYLGELIRELKALKLWDDAYVVLTADHGESLGEHGYWDHGYTLFNAELHVPFVLRWPGVLAAGRRIRENASLLDITPTLMEQLRASAAGQVQGRSLVNSLSGIPPKQPVPVFAGAIKAGPEADAVLREDWKLIRIKAGQNQGGAQGGYLRLLMNFAADPGETKSVWGSNAAIGKELETILDAQVEANKSVRPAYEVEFRELSPELIQQLKAGGYVASGSGDEEAQSQPTTRPTTAPAGTKP